MPQYITVYHNISQYITLYYIISQQPQYITVTTIYHSNHSIPQYITVTTVYYSISQYITVYHNISQYITVYHNISQYITLHFSTSNPPIQQCTSAQYNTSEPYLCGVVGWSILPPCPRVAWGWRRLIPPTSTDGEGVGTGTGSTLTSSVRRETCGAGWEWPLKLPNVTFADMTWNKGISENVSG